jgi:hypothetical protein
MTRLISLARVGESDAGPSIWYQHSNKGPYFRGVTLTPKFSSCRTLDEQIQSQNRGCFLAFEKLRYEVYSQGSLMTSKPEVGPTLSTRTTTIGTENFHPTLHPGPPAGSRLSEKTSPLSLSSRGEKFFSFCRFLKPLDRIKVDPFSGKDS